MPKSRIIVALGDSTTAGTPGFRSPAEHPPEGRGNPRSQYAYWIMQEHPEWKILNRGVAGERTDEIEARYARDVSASNAEAVIILAGVNDLYQGFDVKEVTEGLERIYKRAEAEGLKIVLATILPYNSLRPETQKRMAAVNAWIKDYAAVNGHGFADTFSAVQDPARPFRLVSSPDGLHPDEAAYRLMAAPVARALEETLNRN